MAMAAETDRPSLYNEVKDFTSEGNSLLSRGMAEEALHLFLKAYEIAKETTDKLLLRACCFNAGAAYLACGEASTGLSFLQKALATGEEGFEGEASADLHYNLGLGYQMIDSPMESIQSFAKAAECFNELQNKEMESNSLEKLALCYKSSGMFQEAVQVYEKVCNIYVELGDLNLQATTLSFIANLYVQMKNIDECAKALNLLLDLSQDLEDRNLQAKLFHEVGLIYSSESCYQSASECFEHALLSLDQLDKISADHELKGVISQNLGTVYNKMCNFEKAQLYHQKAIDTFGELGDRKSQSRVFRNLAHAHCHSKNYEEAIICFTHAIQAAKDCGNKRGQWLAIEGRAATFFRRGEYARAVEEYKIALAILTSAGKAGTEHAERVVQKLSNAVEHQVKQSTPRKGSQVNGEQKNETANGKRARYGRQRSDRYNRYHSYITKGLASCSEDEGAQKYQDEDSGEESGDLSYESEAPTDNKQRNQVQEGKRLSRISEASGHYSVTDSEFTKSRTSSGYGTTLHGASDINQDNVYSVNGDTVLKVDRELALSKIHHENVRKEREARTRDEFAKREKSRVCVLQ